jgi:hypothetical protein
MLIACCSRSPVLAWNCRCGSFLFRNKQWTVVVFKVFSFGRIHKNLANSQQAIISPNLAGSGWEPALTCRTSHCAYCTVPGTVAAHITARSSLSDAAHAPISAINLCITQNANAKTEVVVVAPYDDIQLSKW